MTNNHTVFRNLFFYNPSSGSLCYDIQVVEGIIFSDDCSPAVGSEFDTHVLINVVMVYWAESRALLTYNLMKSMLPHRLIIDQ